jgi:hypothetical protein
MASARCSWSCVEPSTSVSKNVTIPLGRLTTDSFAPQPRRKQPLFDLPPNYRLALEDHGSGRPLDLVHGLATTGAIWRRVVPLVGWRRRVIAVDVPGFVTRRGPGRDSSSTQSPLTSPRAWSRRASLLLRQVEHGDIKIRRCLQTLAGGGLSRRPRAS